MVPNPPINTILYNKLISIGFQIQKFCSWYQFQFLTSILACSGVSTSPTLQTVCSDLRWMTPAIQRYIVIGFSHHQYQVYPPIIPWGCNPLDYLGKRWVGASIVIMSRKISTFVGSQTSSIMGDIVSLHHPTPTIPV